jgi:molybdopterin-binding protein
MTVSTGTEAPVEETRVAVGRSLRVALLHGREEASRRAVAQLALASGAEIVARVRATDPRSFVEAAQALRDARPDVVVIQGGAKDEGALAELLEALRLGCGAQRPMPRIFALVDTGVAPALRLRANPFEFQHFAAPSEMVEALRGLRRDGNENIVLRDALIEDGARALATTNGTAALAVDVTERSTSLVLARPDGRVDAAHLVPLGLGMGADHVVVRASLDNVRRWLPWPIDAPALLERVFNRPRAGAPTTEAAVLLEMALAREAIAHALRDVADAGLDVAAIRSAPAMLITGRVASLPKPGQSLLVLVDGLEPSAVSTVFREPDEGHAERIGMVVSVIARRSAKIRITRASGRSVAHVAPGSFGLVAIGDDVDVALNGAGVRGHGRSGELGVLIDARGRPLAVPERDGERIPTVTRWHAALQAIADDRSST